MTREEAARWLAGRLRANWHNASSEAIEAAFLALTAPQAAATDPDRGKTFPVEADPPRCNARLNKGCGYSCKLEAGHDGAHKDWQAQWTDDAKGAVPHFCSPRDDKGASNEQRTRSVRQIECLDPPVDGTKQEGLPDSPCGPETCCVCGGQACTNEAHNPCGGAQLSDKRWVCSRHCWELADPSVPTRGGGNAVSQDGSLCEKSTADATTPGQTGPGPSTPTCATCGYGCHRGQERRLRDVLVCRACACPSCRPATTCAACVGSGSVPCDKCCWGEATRDEDAERREFEEFTRDYGINLSTDGDSNYSDQRTVLAWAAWQTARQAARRRNP